MINLDDDESEEEDESDDDDLNSATKVRPGLSSFSSSRGNLQHTI